MFLLDSVVDFVLAVDVELNVEVAVDWLCGGDDSLEERCFEGGVLNPFLVVVFVLVIVRWDFILFGIENYNSDDSFFMFRSCLVEVYDIHNMYVT